MAFFARHDRVASDQRQSRDVVIEGHYAVPIVLAVTLLATRAKLALVPVILAMARHACCRQLVAIEIAGMAGIALDLAMCAHEWKFCFFVMIEGDGDPLFFVVTGFALGAVPSGMDILNRVAINTRSANPLVALADMARGARDIAVRTS